MRDETSLKKKHLRNGHYFTIIAFCLHSKLLTNYAKTGLDWYNLN